MSSNLSTTKALLGQYGLFQPGVLGNNNVNAAGVQVPMFIGSTTLPTSNVIPANLSTAGAPGSQVTNGVYLGQGISAAGFDSGPLFFQQCSGWKNWGIQVRAETPGNTWSQLLATIWGTFDWDTANGTLTTYSATTGLRTGGNENWFLLGSPSQQSGEGFPKNPLQNAGDAFWTNTIHPLAIRILVSTINSGAVLFAIWSLP